MMATHWGPKHHGPLGCARGSSWLKKGLGYMSEGEEGEAKEKEICVWVVGKAMIEQKNCNCFSQQFKRKMRLHYYLYVLGK